MPQTLRLSIVLLAAALCLAACQQETDTSETDAGAAPATVSVLTAAPEAITVYDDLSGRISADRTVEIRPQVGGIILKRLFEEGATVEADQPLFQIEPAAFEAEVAAAEAVLARTKADLVNAEAKHTRALALAEARVSAERATEDAVAALAQAKANVAEAQANLDRKTLELSHAVVRSPIRGRIGAALVNEGTLAAAGAGPLAVVQQIDVVYADVKQPVSAHESRRELIASGAAADPGDRPVEILSPLGTPYAVSARALFSDITVDRSTGNINIRVEITNTDGSLLPGMFVRARLPRATYHAALTVPQEAVQRDTTGHAQIVVLNPDKTGSLRRIELGPLVGHRYLVAAGLTAGETFVVLGADRAREGVVLAPVPHQQKTAEAAQ